MGVDEARHDGASAQIDLASIIGKQCTHGLVAADADDLLAGNGHGLGVGHGRVHGVDVSIGQYQVG